MEAKKTQIYNLVILDKSGSMESIRKEAIDGYNETLGSIKSTQLKFMDTQEHYVSLAAFCDCGIDMIYDMTPIKDAEKLTKEKYDPCCRTPLFDAIGKAVAKLIDECKEEGWMFSFIGAGEDVVKVATTISITNTIEHAFEDVMYAAASVSPSVRYYLLLEYCNRNAGNLPKNVKDQCSAVKRELKDVILFPKDSKGQSQVIHR